MWPARIFGACFGGVGLTMLFSLWSAPSGGFGSPPLEFRIFGTFVAIPFIVFGATALFGKFPGLSEHVQDLKDQLRESGQVDDPPARTPPTPGKLKCPNCGSSPSQAEVSPHGDVKCDHCSRWYNVHTA